LSSDAAIGLLFVGLLALGIVVISSSDSITTSVEAILFGEFLGVSDGDLWTLGIAVLVVAAVAAWSARPFLLLCFDPDLASVMGYRSGRYHQLMLALVAGTIVVAFQTVGSLLVFGMLLAPAGVGSLLARRVGVMMLWASLVGVASTYIGLLLSYHYGWAAGATVVLVSVMIFFVTLIATSFVPRRSS
jgi:ABC-type Mn2+/Zn2+ transport system permease subunit